MENLSDYVLNPTFLVNDPLERSNYLYNFKKKSDKIPYISSLQNIFN